MRAVRGIARLGGRLAAAVGLLTLLAGVPAGLWRFVGWPLPRTMPATWDGWQAVLTGEFPDTAVVNLLAVAVWIVWAAFGYSVVLEVAAARHGGTARRRPVISPIQAVAALLIAGLSAGPAAVAAVGTLPAPPPAVVSVQPGLAAAGPDLLRTPSGASPATIAPPRLDRAADRINGAAVMDAAAAQPAGGRLPRFAAASADGPLLVQVGQHRYTVTVKRGDTLWDIAGAWLGDHSRWPEIYQLNRDRYDHHGRMKGGDHIEPTWVLVLPADATPPAGSRPTPPPAQPQPPPHPAPPSTGPSTPPGPSTQPTPPPSAAATTAPPTAAPTHPDDGVVVPVPTPTGSGSAAASPTPTATHPPSSRSPRPNPPGISLPGGSWVDLGLAAAIAAAAALVWIQRRRRYKPRPPAPQLRLDDPDLAPLPPVVTEIRRGLRHATAPPAPDTDPDDIDPDDTSHDTGDADLPWAEPDPAGEAEPARDDQPPTPVPVPVAPNLDHPLLQTWPPAGLGLVGPGAEAAGRGFLAAALAADGAHGPDARGRVVVAASTLATLLGTHAVTVTDTGRLTVTTGLPEALDLLEEQTLHRTRLVFDHEVDDVAALREADPAEEPLPPLLLIADTGAAHEQTRIAAVLSQGQRLDIHGVLLGAWPDGNTVVVADDGTTSRAEADRVRHGGHPADVGRLAVLDPAQTADLLRTLAEAHTGAAQPAPPVEPHPAASTRPPAATRPASHPATADEHAAADVAAAPEANQAPNEKKAAVVRPAGQADTAAAQPGGERVEPAATAPERADPQPAAAPPGPAGGESLQKHGVQPDDVDEPDGAELDGAQPGEDEHAAAAGARSSGDLADADEGDEGDDAADPATVGAGHARVVVLGPPGIVDLPQPRRPGEQPLRSNALEVLVYLIAGGGQAAKHRIIADVLAGEKQSKARARLNTYVSNLRSCLRRAGGPATYVAGPDEQYALNRDVLDVDLWRMQAAIAAAEATEDPQARVAALRTAVACYTGPLSAGRDYEWVEPFREAVRQQAVDAHLALVAAVADDDPADAVRVLRAAIDHNPHNEALYRQAMHLYARLGDVEGIRELRRLLTRRMGEVDTEPDEATIALADRLVTDLKRRPRGPSRLPRDAA